MSPFVVELTGARGVGKSTLVEFVRAEFSRRQVPLGVLKRPTMARRLWHEVSAVPAKLRMERLWRSWGLNSQQDITVFRQRFRRYLLRRDLYAREPAIFLLDEGLFQLMMMVCIRTGTDAELIAQSLAEVVPMPDIVVSIEAPESAIDARRRQRGNAGDLLKPRISPSSRTGLESLQAYLRRLADQATTRVIIVENTEYSKLEAIAVDVVDEVLTGYRGAVTDTTREAILPAL